MMLIGEHANGLTAMTNGKETALTFGAIVFSAICAWGFVSMFSWDKDDVALAGESRVMTATASPSDQTRMMAPQSDASGPAMDSQEALPLADPLGRLKIAKQSWKRGGLGSRALVTFTLDNRNDFAVKDVEISCAFISADGAYATNRRRLMAETIKTKSRKTYPLTMLGFVAPDAARAKCELVTAARA